MKVVRYFFVGAASAAVDFFVFSLLALGYDVHWFLAGLLGFVLATTVNYFLSIQYVFQSGTRFSRRTEITLIFMVSGIGLIINQSILFLLIERMAINMLIAKILATLVVFFWNYGIRHSYVFKPRQDVNSFH